MRGCCLAIGLTMFGVAGPCLGQVDEAVLGELRAGLHRQKALFRSVSGRVHESIVVTGDPPPSVAPALPKESGKSLGITRVWGASSSERDYDWSWSGVRWRVSVDEEVKPGRWRTHEFLSDGEYDYSQTAFPGAKTGRQGSIDTRRGGPPTPSSLAFMPDYQWLEDSISALTLDEVRRGRTAAGEPVVTLRGHNRAGNVEYEFAPALGYLPILQRRSMAGVATTVRITATKATGGRHVPIDMVEERHVGATHSTRIWRSLRLQVTDLKLDTLTATDFAPKWREGVRIIDVPAGKMVRYTNGNMVFPGNLAGRTPGRMASGLALIGGTAAAGLLLLWALLRRRRALRPTPA